MRTAMVCWMTKTWIKMVDWIKISSIQNPVLDSKASNTTMSCRQFDQFHDRQANRLFSNHFGHWTTVYLRGCFDEAFERGTGQSIQPHFPWNPVSQTALFQVLNHCWDDTVSLMMLLLRSFTTGSMTQDVEVRKGIIWCYLHIEEEFPVSGFILILDRDWVPLLCYGG